MGISIHTTDRAERVRNDIIEFIGTQPGAIKQELDTYVIKKGSGSKKTIQRELRFLVEEEGSIYVDKERPNSARHRLFINPNSEIRSILTDLANLKKAFFTLINQVKIASDTIEGWGEDEHVRNENLDENDSHKILPGDIELAHSSIRILFEHTLVIYLLYFLFEWPKKVPDNKNLDRLYLLTFQTIKEIRTELSNSLPHRQQFEPVTLQDKFVNRLMRLSMDPAILRAVFMNLDKFVTYEYSVPVVDALWKFGSPFVPTSEKDWVKLFYDYGISINNMTKEKKDIFRRTTLLFKRY